MPIDSKLTQQIQINSIFTLIVQCILMFSICCSITQVANHQQYLDMHRFHRRLTNIVVELKSASELTECSEFIAAQTLVKYFQIDKSINEISTKRTINISQKKVNITNSKAHSLMRWIWAGWRTKLWLMSKCYKNWPIQKWKNKFNRIA